MQVRCLITCDAFPVGLFYIYVALSKYDLCHYCALKFLRIFFLHTVVHALLSYKPHPREYLHLLNSRIGIWTIIFLSVFINFFAPYKDFVNIFLISGITFTPIPLYVLKKEKCINHFSLRHLWVILIEARNESDPESLLSDMSFGILVYEERGKAFSGKKSLDWFWGKLNHVVLLLLLLLVE